MLAAYHRAEVELATRAPACDLPWSLVAGIGKVESDHARGGSVDPTGTTATPILGPVLDGTAGTIAVPDTDHGRLDRDPVWDRAVGPTQFLPATWATYGIAVPHTSDPTAPETGAPDPGAPDPDTSTGTSSRVPDINNVFDAAASTGRYLCAGRRDVATPTGAHDAVFTYNHSEDYVAHVLAWARAYAAGASTIPDASGTGAGSPDAGAGSSASLATSVGVPAGDASTPAAAAAGTAGAAVPGAVAPGGVASGPATTPAPSTSTAAGSPSAGAPRPGATSTGSGGSGSSGSSGGAGVPPAAAPVSSAHPPGPAPAGPAVPSPPPSSTAPSSTAPSSTAPPSTAPPSTGPWPAALRPAAPHPAAPRVDPDWCAAHLPPVSVAPVFGLPTTAVRTTASRTGNTTTCSVTGPGGPVLRVVVTGFGDRSSAYAAAAGVPATAGSLADLLLVNDADLIRLTVPATSATAALSPTTAMAALSSIRSTW